MVSMLSASDRSFGAKVFPRKAKPRAAEQTESTMSSRKNTRETGSPSKVWTDCTRPERLMNVPTITKQNVKAAHMMAQPLNIPRCRYTVKLCIRAMHISQGSKLAFSTGSHPQ